VHVLETIGGAVLEWIVGEGMGKGRELLGREPQVRDLDTVIRTAVEPAVRVVTTDDATRQSLRAALDEKLTARLDLSPGALADPATCVRRWLAPLGETGLGGLTYWQHTSVDGDLVADALAAEVVRGIAENARRGGSLEPLATEFRFDAVLSKLGKIEQQLDSLTAIRSSPASLRDRPTMTPARWGRYVTRPAVEAAVAERVLDPQAGPAPMLVVWGSGGFGKTWIAQNLCLSRPALDRFTGGVLWVQLSEDRSLTRVTSELTGLIRILAGTDVAPAGPRQLGRWVGELIEDQPTLLVIDDAWTQGHVEPFVDTLPPTCFRIVTTRNQRAAPPGTPLVHVDAMRPEESVQLLRGRLTIDDADLEPLLDVCAGFPMIMALVGGQLDWVVNQGSSTREAVRYVRERLRKQGIVAFDGDRQGTGPRSRTVRATMESSIEFAEEQHPGATQRYLELAAFQDDVDIPREIIADLWRHRAGLDSASAESLLLDFADKSLVQRFQIDPPVIRLHDVMRTYLRERAGERLIADISRDILDLYHDVDLGPDPEDGEPRW
jgi:hypothetical protein